MYKFGLQIFKQTLLDNDIFLIDVLDKDLVAERERQFKDQAMFAYSPALPDSMKSCPELMENCENIENDEFVFGKRSSGDLT